MKVTVILSTNLEKPLSHLLLSLSSVTDQVIEGHEIEIQVCIDGPVDPNKLASYFAVLEKGSMRYGLVQSDVRQGLAKSLNKLITVSDTDVFVRHDDDDIMLRNRVSKLVEVFSSRSSPTLAGTAYYVGTLQIASDQRPSIDFQVSSLVTPPSNLQLESIPPLSPPFAHPTIAFSRLTLSGNSPCYDEDYLFAQDFKFYLDHLHEFNFESIIDSTLIYIKAPISPGKRSLQLALHERALFDFWRVYFDTNIDEIHAFRTKYLTREFSSAAVNIDPAADNFLGKALESTIRYRSDSTKLNRIDQYHAGFSLS